MGIYYYNYIYYNNVSYKVKSMFYLLKYSVHYALWPEYICPGVIWGSKQIHYTKVVIVSTMYF